MVQSCKGICGQIKATSVPNNLRYKDGQKRCGLCNCYFAIKNYSCPCCNTKLRSKPRKKTLWNQM